MFYVPRAASEPLRLLMRTFPVVYVHGPRKCGKSTFVREELGGWLALDLEAPADLDQLQSDVQGFFEKNPRRVLIDEAQRFPDLFPALRHFIDRGKGPGRFVLTGSANPAIVRSISESLAGRVGFLDLTPFRMVELASRKHAQDRWFWGGYPPVHALPGANRRLAWLDGYVTAFLERDLPNLGYRMSPERLRALWTMLTHVHGSVLNPADLARSLTVSHHTVAAHLDVLEGSFMIRRLHPHFANVQKRLTKSPKVYIRDTGLLHFLAGLKSSRELDTWPRRGHSFEGLVVEELCSLARERVVRPHLAYWRTLAQGEVDLLIGDGRRLLPIEIKLAASVSGYDARGLTRCMKDLGLEKGWVVYTGEEFRGLGRNIEVVPWSAIAKGEFDFGLGRRTARRARRT